MREVRGTKKPSQSRQRKHRKCLDLDREGRGRSTVRYRVGFARFHGVLSPESAFFHGDSMMHAYDVYLNKFNRYASCGFQGMLP